MDSLAEAVKRKYPFCSSIPFEYVSHFFDQISTRSRGDRRKHLTKFREHYVNREANDIFQLYRLILPGLDRVRGMYGMKEAQLASILIKSCGVPDGSDTAKCVREWKQPRVVNAGDFSAVLEHYLFVPNCGREAGTLRSAEYTVGQVNEDLDRLTKTTEREERERILQSMIVKTTPRQMKWIIQILLRNLKLGLSEMVVLSDFHQDAGKLYDSTMDLEKVCCLLKDENVRHQIKDIEPGIPARAQLAAQKRTVEEMAAAIGAKDFIVEMKFDGERCQLHKIGDEFMYFSRNGINHGKESYFDMFNPIARRQILRTRCILDGELVIYNRAAKSFEPFGSLRPALKAARSGKVTDEYREYEDFRDSSGHRRHLLPDLDQLELLYMAFDILYVEDRSVTALPLYERQKLLQASVGDDPDIGVSIGGGLKGRVISVIPDATFLGGICLSKKGTGVKDINEMFQTAISIQEEGVVAKIHDAPWITNDRGTNWMKMKPDYVTNHEIDALIVGGYYGTGKRANAVAEYLMGILDNTSDPPKYVTFCRVGTGLSENERSRIAQLLRHNFQKLKKPPECYQTTGYRRETPDEWITDPTASIVLQINADVRTVFSEVFATRYTLRFPRATAIRWDKGHEDILTMRELNALVETVVGTSRGKRVFGTPVKTSISRKRPFSVPKHFSKSPAKPKLVQNTALKDRVVYFIGYGCHEKDALELLASELGATVHMNLTKSVNLVFGADPNQRQIRILADDGKYDIVSVNWLLKCNEAGTKVPLRPQDYLYRSIKAAHRLTDLLKGENTTEEIEARDIEQIVEQHLNQFVIKARHRDAIENTHYASEELPLESIFEEEPSLNHCCIYTLTQSRVDPNNSRQAVVGSNGWKRLQEEAKAMFFHSKLMIQGVRFSVRLIKKVTHIVIDEESSSKISSPTAFLQCLRNKDPEIDFSWLYDAMNCRSLFLLGSKKLTQLGSVQSIQDTDKVLDAVPRFAENDVVLNPRTKKRYLKVQDWPWEEFIESYEVVEFSKKRRIKPKTETQEKTDEKAAIQPKTKKARIDASKKESAVEVRREDEDISRKRTKKATPSIPESSASPNERM